MNSVNKIAATLAATFMASSAMAAIQSQAFDPLAESNVNEVVGGTMPEKVEINFPHYQSQLPSATGDPLTNDYSMVSIAPKTDEGGSYLSITAAFSDTLKENDRARYIHESELPLEERSVENVIELFALDSSVEETDPDTLKRNAGSVEGRVAKTGAMIGSSLRMGAGVFSLGITDANGNTIDAFAVVSGHIIPLVKGEIDDRLYFSKEEHAQAYMKALVSGEKIDQYFLTAGGHFTQGVIQGNMDNSMVLERALNAEDLRYPDLPEDSDVSMTLEKIGPITMPMAIDYGGLKCNEGIVEGMDNATLYKMTGENVHVQFGKAIGGIDENNNVVFAAGDGFIYVIKPDGRIEVAVSRSLTENIDACNKSNKRVIGPFDSSNKEDPQFFDEGVRYDVADVDNNDVDNDDNGHYRPENGGGGGGHDHDHDPVVPVPVPVPVPLSPTGLFLLTALIWSCIMGRKKKIPGGREPQLKRLNGQHFKIF